MRAFAKTLSIVSVVLLLVVLYMLWGAQIQLRVVNMSVQGASERQEAFDGIRAAALAGDISVELFTNAVPEDAEGYCFVTYELEAVNYGLLPAEWVRIRVSPSEGDVAQIGIEQQMVHPLERRRMSSVVLTRQGEQPEHGIWLEYYVFGRQLYSRQV